MGGTESSSLPLFPEPSDRLPGRMGRVTVSASDASSILTKASGFMGDDDFTVNPYSGCGFACAYCHAAAFAP